MLEASTRILASEGAPAMTTNAVAELAGVSVGSLYQYFPNRDAILVALIERFETGMQARMQAALSRSRGGFAEKLEAAVRSALAHHFEAPEVATVLEAEEHRLGVTAKPLLAQAESEMSAFIRAFVRAHARRDDAELGRVAHRIEIVGRTLVDDALHRRDSDPRVPSEIVSAMTACAPPDFWSEGVG